MELTTDIIDSETFSKDGVETILLELIQVMDEGVVVLDATGRIVIANQLASEILGLPIEQMLGKSSIDPDWNAIHEDGSPFPGDMYPATMTLRTGQRQRGVVMGINLPQEGLRWILVNTSPIRLQEQKITAVVATFHDITKSESLRKELQASEFKLRLMVGQMQAHIWTVDKNLVFTYSDGGGLKDLGLERNEVVEKGVDLYQFFHTKDPEYLPIKAHLRSLRGEEVSYASEWQGRYFNSFTKPLRDSEDHIVGVIGVATDVTDIKKMELEQEKLQHQLLQAQKLDAVGQLAGGIAHDFNNILTSIKGYTDLSLDMLAKNKNFDVSKYLTEVQKGCESAVALVSKLLSFSKEQEVEQKHQNLRTVVEDSLAMLRPIIPSSIVIATDLHEKVPAVFIDALSVYQVIVNLCINARDAMHEKGNLTLSIRYSEGVSVMCSSCHLEVHGNYVVLSIKDNGEGIPLDVQNRIFEPFYTSKELSKGTGLGLSIVHGIIHSQGGHIKVVSEEGKGAEFLIYFPVQ